MFLQPTTCCPHFTRATESQIQKNHEHLARQGLGNAGDIFDRLLSAVGLDRNEDCFITNITHCRPSQNRTPTIKETTNCSYVLMSEIQLIKPSVIFTLGGVASSFLLGKPKVYMKTDNGKLLRNQRISVLTGKDTLIVPVVHPAYVLRAKDEPEKMREGKRMMGDAVRGGLRAINHPKLKERAQ